VARPLANPDGAHALADPVCAKHAAAAVQSDAAASTQSYSRLNWASRPNVSGGSTSMVPGSGTTPRSLVQPEIDPFQTLRSSFGKHDASRVQICPDCAVV
jgi:hypothetical protein